MKYRTEVVFTTVYRWEVEANSENEAHNEMVNMLSCHEADDFMIFEDENIDIYVEEVDDDYSLEFDC